MWKRPGMAARPSKRCENGSRNDRGSPLFDSEIATSPSRHTTFQDRQPSPPMKKSTTRRQFMKQSAALAGGAMVQPLIGAEGDATARQATGVKVGEVTDTTAIVWTRLTTNPTRNNEGVIIPQRA